MSDPIIGWENTDPGAHLHWNVRAEQDASLLWGASWWTDERAPEGSAPLVEAHVSASFVQASDARGHAAMWIARYEDARANDGAPVAADDTPWRPSPADLAEAFEAHNARFGAGDVTLGEG